MHARCACQCCRCCRCCCRYVDSRSAPGAPASDAAFDAASCAALFTVGELALLRAAKPPSGLTVLLQALTAHTFITSASAAAAAASYGAGASQQLPDDGGTADAAAEPGGAADGGADGGGAGSGGGGARAVPAAVQAHAWIALGKVCLGDEALAKKCVPLFVQVRRGCELRSCIAAAPVLTSRRCCNACMQCMHTLSRMRSVAAWKRARPLPLPLPLCCCRCVAAWCAQELGRSPLPVVRNNILVGLSDMLIHYTALVDPHMPRLAACLRCVRRALHVEAAAAAVAAAAAAWRDCCCAVLPLRLLLRALVLIGGAARRQSALCFSGP